MLQRQCLRQPRNDLLAIRLVETIAQCLFQQSKVAALQPV